MESNDDNPSFYYFWSEYKRYRKPLEILHAADPSEKWLPKGDPFFLGCNEKFVDPDDKTSKVYSFKKGTPLGVNSFDKYVQLWYEPCGLKFYGAPQPTLYSYRYNSVQIMLLSGLQPNEIMARTGHLTLEGLKAYINVALKGEGFSETQAKIDDILS